jgi:predicted dehydrogenase
MEVEVTLAQIGCGYWGPNLLRNFSATPNCRVKYVVDSSEERRRFIRSHYPQTEAIADMERVLQDDEVKALVIATPAATHYALAKRALEAGKHLLVEKPLAMSVHEADALIALAATRQRTLMVGHTFLYNAAVHYMKKLLDEGTVGQPHYLYSQRLNLGQIRSDVNAWWNLAPHDVSILLFLMGGERPVSVFAHGMDYIQPGVEDVVFATLTWPSRVSASIHVSWLDPNKVRRMTLVGSKKMVVYDDISDDKIAIYDKGFERVSRAGERMDYDNFSHFKLQSRVGDVLLPKVNFKEPLQVEASHFVECVASGTTPLTGPDHARAVVAVLEAGQKSLKAGVKVAP